MYGVGSDAELGSNLEDTTVALVLAAPGVASDKHGRPLGAGENVVVGAMEKLGVNGGHERVDSRRLRKRDGAPARGEDCGRPPRPPWRG